MFNRRFSFAGIGAAVGAILSGVLSSGGNALHFNGPPSSVPRPKKAKRPANWARRGHADVHRGWRPFAFEVNRDPNSREATRRRRQIEAGSLRVENGLVP